MQLHGILICIIIQNDRKIEFYLQFLQMALTVFLMHPVLVGCNELVC